MKCDRRHDCVTPCRTRQAVAVALTAALLVTAPGLPCYRAFAGGPVKGTPVIVGMAAGGVVPGGGLLRPSAPNGGAILPGGGFRGGLGGKSLRSGLRYRETPAPAPVQGKGTSILTLPSPLQGEGVGREAESAVSEWLGGTIEKVEEAVSELSSGRDVPAAYVWSSGQKTIEPLIRERWHQDAPSGFTAPTVPLGVKKASPSPSPLPKGEVIRKILQVTGRLLAAVALGISVPVWSLLIAALPVTA